MGSEVKCIFREAEELELPNLQIVVLGMRLRVRVAFLRPVVLREDKSPQPSGAESWGRVTGGVEHTHANCRHALKATAREIRNCQMVIANCFE